MKDAGAGAYVKGQHAGCSASGQPLTAATRKTLFSMSGLSRRSLPTGEGRSGQHMDWKKTVQVDLKMDKHH